MVGEEQVAGRGTRRSRVRVATVDHADMRGLGTDSSCVRRGAACCLGSAVATCVAANNVVEGSPVTVAASRSRSGMGCVFGGWRASFPLVKTVLRWLFAFAPAQCEFDECGPGVTSRAMAHTKPHSSRAMATTILLCGTRRAARRLKREHRRVCAAQAMSVTALGKSA